MAISRKTKSSTGLKSGVELTEAEWEIMKVVWEKEPCAAGTVQESLTASRDWAYSTVKTLMERMVKKGFLSPKKTKNVTRYSATISEDDAKRLEIAKIAKRAFNDASFDFNNFTTAVFYRFICLDNVCIT